MKTLIKHNNAQQIINFACRKESKIQGTKLEALYRLIQKKGSTIDSLDENLNGVRCLEFIDGLLIAIKRTGSTGKFYPCGIRTYLLKKPI